MSEKPGTPSNTENTQETAKKPSEDDRKFRELVEGASDLITLCDEAGRFTYVNRVAGRILGVCGSDAVGIPAFDFIHPDDRDRTRGWFEKCGNDRIGKASIENRQVNRETGEVSYMLWTSNFDYDGRGRIVGVRSIGRDIPERREAEDALATQKRFLERAQEIGSIGTWELDIGKNRLIWTDETYRVFGLPIGTELTYETFLGCVHPDDRKYVDTKWNAALQGEPYDIEHRVVAEGNVKWVREKAELEFDSSGECLRGTGVTQDITYRKRAEESLRVSEEAFRSLAENIQDCIMRYDNQHRHLYQNEAGYRASGFTKEEFVGKTHRELGFDIKLCNLWDEKIGQVFSSCEKNSCVFEWDSTEGKVAFNMHLFPEFGSDGKVKTVLGISYDVTDRNRWEEQREFLIRNLEAKNAELENFTYTVSHDLKAPLIGISGFLGHLKKDALSGDRDRIDADVEFIAGAVRKMESLLDDLLELSRVGRTVNPSEKVSLSVLAKKGMKILSSQLSEQKIDVHIPQEMPEVHVDAARFEQVFENLFENAMKYMGDQPKPRIDLGVHPGKGETVCFVRDNGIGIELRFHDQVFGLFNQLDPAVEGTGVGLALVRRIVEAHDGRTWVESEGPGHGSTFCFALPNGPKRDETS